MINSIDNLLNFTNDIFQKKELRPLLGQVAEVARLLWERGWAERNAGNFSANITSFFTPRELEKLTTYPFFPFTGRFSSLAGNLFLVSGTGTRMRQMAKNPIDHVCLVYLPKEVDVFHLINANPEARMVMPTSELKTHLAIHQQLLKNNDDARFVLHAHVTELIALTHLPGYRSSETINHLLKSIHPEISLYLPGGAGFVPYQLAGTDSIASATIGHLGQHKAVVWEKHGCIATGSDPDSAFDILDLMAKAVRIFFMVASAGHLPDGLTPDQIKELEKNTPTD